MIRFNAETVRCSAGNVKMLFNRIKGYSVCFSTPWEYPNSGACWQIETFRHGAPLRLRLAHRQLSDALRKRTSALGVPSRIR